MKLKKIPKIGRLKSKYFNDYGNIKKNTSVNYIVISDFLKTTIRGKGKTHVYLPRTPVKTTDFVTKPEP